MSNDYDNITAYHYSFYRPALHLPILESCLEGKYFEKGLDIGCGTGHSSIALANFCNEIVGLDPSSDMLNKAVIDKKVNYLHWDEKKLPFPNFYFGIVTLAGSWYYGQSQYLLDELTRVTQSGGKVLLYDFNIVLNEVLRLLNIPNAESSYNHQVNFSKFHSNHLNEVEMKKSSITISITSQQLAHLILSVKPYYLFLEQKWGKQAVFSKTENTIQPYLMSTRSILTTYIYSTLYQKK